MHFIKLKSNDQKDIMDFMKQQLYKSEAEVGTFFYDVNLKKLILTDSCPIDIAPSFGLGKNKKTTRKLHPQIWKENNMEGDYTQCPRGRVFYNIDSNSFDIAVGKWVENVPNLLDLVKNRFHLQDQKCELKYDSHWDIGNGFYE